MLNNPNNPGVQPGRMLPPWFRGVVSGNQPQAMVQSPIQPSMGSMIPMPWMPPAQPYQPQQPTIPPSEMYTRSIQLTEDEQRDVVRQCMEFKINTRNHAYEKKLSMRRNYAYTENKFVGDDLLPVPDTSGSDRDVNSSRPQVFMPCMRELVKQLYAYIAMTLLPNDEDYFRIRAKYPTGVDIEDDLTDGFKFIFKKQRLSEQIKRFLYNGIWSGMMVAYPSFTIPISSEWGIHPTSGQFTSKEVEGEPVLKLNVWNPIHFYIEPVPCNEPRWGYYAYRKKQDVLDSKFTMTDAIPKLKMMGNTTYRSSQETEGLPVDTFNQLNEIFIDDQENLKWDAFYWPYIKLNSGREFRNINIGIAEERCLAEFRPNMIFTDSPAVYTTWMNEVDSPYGTGPCDDVQVIQRIINLLENYVIESLARNGNTWAVRKGCDISNLFGVVARVIQTPGDPREFIMNLAMSHEELEVILNHIGMLKAEMTMVFGASDPFTGASRVDHQITATQSNLLQETAISVNREATEHIGYTGVAKILDKCATILAHLYRDRGPVTVRTEGDNGPEFKDVDLSLYLTGDFTIELMSTNASQSKQQQIGNLMQLVTALMQNPQGVFLAQPIIEKIAVLSGERDMPEILEKIKELMSGLQQQSAPPMGATPNGSVGGQPQNSPSPVAGGQPGAAQSPLV